MFKTKAMILEEYQKLALIKGPKPDFIHKAQQEAIRYNVLVNGKNVPEYLNQISGFENDAQYKARKKYVKSTKHIVANLLRHVDKCFSAKGTVRMYSSEPKSSSVVEAFKDN